MNMNNTRFLATARRGAAIAFCGALLAACTYTPWNYERAVAADGTNISVRVRDWGEGGRQWEVAMPNGKWIPCDSGDCAGLYALASPHNQFRESNNDED